MTIADLREIAGRTYLARRWTRNPVGKRISSWSNRESKQFLNTKETANDSIRLVVH